MIKPNAQLSARTDLDVASAVTVLIMCCYDGRSYILAQKGLVLSANGKKTGIS
jgi:hypothetical protein